MSAHYLVVGLGLSGYSVVAYLVNKGCNVSVTDDRNDPPQLSKLRQEFAHVELSLGQIVVPQHITHMIVSPGVSLQHAQIAQALTRGVALLGDIELFAQIVDKPVLAITGSNGKSTTTSLLGAMATSCGISAGIGGNLGIPALDLVQAKHDCYILELSSFQLETTTSLKCIAATVLNVSADHMDRYTSLEDYAHTKLQIYKNTHTAIVNRQDPLTWVAYTTVSKIISFGLDKPMNDNYGITMHAEAAWLCRGTRLLMPVGDIAMLGQHNVANALAALALGEVAGFTMDGMLQTLRTFGGLAHRCEKVYSANDVVWINDSKGTNVGATLAAIAGLCTSVNGKWVIILGGLGKNADFTPLIAPIAKYCRAAILIGTDAPILWGLLHHAVPCFMAKDLREAVKVAKQQTKPGDGVLLSPACASLDMFDNYMQRGDVFKQMVLEEIGSDTSYAKAKAL